MMTRFHDNTIITKFIKYIISHFNLPIIPFWETGAFVKKGGLYIFEGNLYRALKSGNPLNADDNEFFDLIMPFIFGKEYRNLTTRYIGTSDGYDAQTHYYLGEYLRTIKAYYGIDLMSLYNCSNGVYIDDVDFDGKMKSELSTSSQLEDFGIYNKVTSQTHKILSVPIKFGKSYHIAIDSNMPISVMPVIYDNSGLNELLTKDLLLPRGSDKISIGKYMTFQSARFQKIDVEIPKIDYQDTGDVNTEWTTEYLGQYERFLRLLIKVPRSNTSSIVVLEDGDISFLERSAAVVKEYPGENNTRTIRTTNSILIGDNPNIASTPKLAFFNDGNTYAFSDTLIQYLLLNVISNMDEIDDNITRIQDYISSMEFRKTNNGLYYKGFMRTGVWDDSMKVFILKTVMESPYLPIKLDKFGFVDSETESVITRGQVI